VGSSYAEVRGVNVLSEALLWVLYLVLYGTIFAFSFGLLMKAGMSEIKEIYRRFRRRGYGGFREWVLKSWRFRQFYLAEKPMTLERAVKMATLAGVSMGSFLGLFAVVFSFFYGLPLERVERVSSIILFASIFFTLFFLMILSFRYVMERWRGVPLPPPEVEKIKRMPAEKAGLRAKLKDGAIACGGLASVILFLFSLINIPYTGLFSMFIGGFVAGYMAKEGVGWGAINGLLAGLLAGLINAVIITIYTTGLSDLAVLMFIVALLTYLIMFLIGGLVGGAVGGVVERIIGNYRKWRVRVTKPKQTD